MVVSARSVGAAIGDGVGNALTVGRVLKVGLAIGWFVSCMSSW